MILCKHGVSLSSLLLLSMLAGCGSGVEMAPVSGTVTIDGKPYPDAKVVFYPVAEGESTAAGRPSFGKTDEQGNYSLSTESPGDGARLGPHTVSLFCSDEHKTLRPDLKELKFSRVRLSEGKVEVVAGDNRFDYALSIQDVKERGSRR